LLYDAAGRGRGLFDGADLGTGEFGVDEELERVELLVLLHEAVQRGAPQPGQCDAGGVAQQVEGGGALGAGGRLESAQVWLPVTVRWW
jgi:hypothetical protein